MARFINPRKRTRRKKVGVPVQKSEYTEEMLFRTADELHAGKIKLERVRYNDDVVPGLRFVINASKLVTAHCQYSIGEERKYLLIGSLNPERDDHITIKKARERAETIKALADKGIDPAEGLHKRLLRELDEKGTRWQPK